MLNKKACSLLYSFRLAIALRHLLHIVFGRNNIGRIKGILFVFLIDIFDMNYEYFILFKLMETGETGCSGLPALRHVKQGQEAGRETVTTQLQLMEAENVQVQTMSQEFVLPTPRSRSVTRAGRAPAPTAALTLTLTAGLTWPSTALGLGAP